MRTAAVLLLFALAPLTARADDAPALKVPAEVTAKPSTITELKAETTGKRVVWVPLTPGLSLRPVDDGRTLLFAGGPGRYELLAYTALGDVPSDPARVVIIIEGAAPPPLPPDEFAAKLRAAFALDKPRKDDVGQLVAVYREAVSAANDRSVTSTTDLLKRVRAVANKLIPGDALPQIRATCGEEKLRVLGMSGDEEMSAATRERAAAMFKRLADALEAANK